jgi:hypothetical protein
MTKIVSVETIFFDVSISNVLAQFLQLMLWISSSFKKGEVIVNSGFKGGSGFGGPFF